MRDLIDLHFIDEKQYSSAGVGHAALSPSLVQSEIHTLSVL